MPEDKTNPLSREQLYELVWKEPMLRIGEQLGVSSSYMARVCTELRVPRPPRGYWAKLEFGKAPARPALPPARPGEITEWSPGDFIGKSERAVAAKLKRSIPPSSEEQEGPPSVEPQRRPRKNGSGDAHPLLADIKPHFKKTRDSRTGILRPYKRLMPDVLVSEPCIDAGIAAADALFRALTKRGHRVTIAPHGGHFKREDVDLREVPRKNHYMESAWTPERPTVVFIGEVAIGLTIYEMTEATEMMSVGSKYVPVATLSAEQRRRMTGPHYWTSTQDLPSGRFRVQAYSTAWRVKWVKQWSEAKRGQLSSLIAGIVQELEAEGPVLGSKIEAAAAKAEEEHRQWQEQERLRREAAERAHQEKLRKESRQELLAAISGWDEAQMIGAYFAEVERTAERMDDGPRQQLLERLSHAKALIGTIDPVEALLRWKAPGERR
ncbi:MAG: hypothetical protein IV097_08895 [Burkholderiaceae bacterium]|nr:hypothetical protein [Burkholderiaceae bacterium]